MAIQLYKAGDTHTVRGIECEVCNFDLAELDLRLSEGWVKDTSELEVTGASSEGNQDAEAPEEININPVRLKAKEAGIEGWQNKRIKTLEAELEG